MRKAAAFFDLDKTIIATTTSAAYSRPLFKGGLVTRADVLRTAYAHLHYLLRSADEDSSERLRRQLSELAVGWDVGRVRAIVEDGVGEYINPYVYDEAVALIAEHHDLGHDVVIVSASAYELVEPIATALGADQVIATRMEVADGRYTGEIEFYAYGENKAQAMRELAVEKGYHLAACYAYSDSITDEPMLDAVGHAAAVNPDKAMRRLAVERGWDILAFAHPISLRAIIKANPKRSAAIAAVGAGAAGAAGVLAYKAIRNRTS